MTVLALAVSALVGALGLTACSGGAASTPSASPAGGPALPTTPAGASQRLSETGSSLMAPLFTQWGPAYHTQFPQVTVSTASSSSGTGILSAAAGTVEAWGRDPKNPVKGWYGLKKGLRGRFGMYVPPVLEALGLVELEHQPKNNRVRAKE